jgi:glycosyltransferase EpsD
LSKKVLYVATSDIHIRTFHQPILKKLYEKGFQVTLAIEKRSDYKFDYVNEVVYLPFKRSPFKWGNFKAFYLLLKLIKSQNFDYVHSHTPVVSVLTRIAVFLSFTRPKVIYTAHGFHFYSGSSLFNWIIFYPIEYLLSFITNTLITINKEDFRLSVKKMKAKENFLLPGMGVSVEKFETSTISRKYYGISDDSLVFVNVAELNKNKNQIYTIKIFQKLLISFPNSKLLLVGKGGEKSNLENYVKKNHLENFVIFLGWQENVFPILSISDYGISSSIREGFGIALVEKQMCGLPVFASINRGHKEVVDNEINGALYPLNDIEEAVRVIKDSINSNIFDKELIIEHARDSFGIKISLDIQLKPYL